MVSRMRLRTCLTGSWSRASTLGTKRQVNKLTSTCQAVTGLFHTETHVTYRLWHTGDARNLSEELLDALAEISQDYFRTLCKVDGRGFQMSIKLGGAAHGFGLIHMFELVEAAG